MIRGLGIPQHLLDGPSNSSSAYLRDMQYRRFLDLTTMQHHQMSTETPQPSEAGQPENEQSTPVASEAIVQDHPEDLAEIAAMLDLDEEDEEDESAEEDDWEDDDEPAEDDDWEDDESDEEEWEEDDEDEEDDGGDAMSLTNQGWTAVGPSQPTPEAAIEAAVAVNTEGVPVTYYTGHPSPTIDSLLGQLGHSFAGTTRRVSISSEARLETIGMSSDYPDEEWPIDDTSVPITVDGDGVTSELAATPDPVSLAHRMEELKLEISLRQEEAVKLAPRILNARYKALFDDIPELVHFSWMQYSPYYDPNGNNKFRVDENSVRVNSHSGSAWRSAEKYDMSEAATSLIEVLRQVGNDPLLTLYGDHKKIVVRRDAEAPEVMAVSHN